MPPSSSSSSPCADGAGIEALPAPTLGSVIGERYLLTELLGRGGMGTVYGAVDQKRDVAVALKLMHMHLARVREAQQRFRHEANALHRLRSDHVARLYDFGHHGPSPYLVMERVAGHDLTREVEQHGPLAWGDALSVIDQICLALSAVHSEGLVHRDMKPRNILVERVEGRLRVKVVDFGLSKFEPHSGRASAPITRQGMAVGSLQYMAPEQAIGSPNVDARADVFSTGCILYYLLTGEPPFSQRELARAGRSGKALTFASIHHRRSDVPFYVDEVLRVALSPDPNHRFRTMGALRMALESDIPGCGDSRPPPSAPVAPVRLASTAAAFTMTIVLVVYWLLARAG